MPKKSAFFETGDGPFRALLDAAVDAMIVIDSKGCILMANHAAEGMFGYKNKEMLGSNVNMLMTAHHAGRHDGYLSNYTETERKRIIGIGRTEDGRRKDGSAFPLEISVGEYRNGGERFFVGILRDISQRRITEQAIKRERDFSQAILETTPALVIVVDEKGYIIRFNGACERVTGYSRQDVLGRDIFDLLVPETDMERYRDVSRRLASGEDVVRMEAAWKTATGKNVHIAWTHSRLEGEGGRHTYLIGTGYDITESRALQEQLARAQRLEALGQLTGGVAHDFNNLLAVIQGNMEMLETAMPEDDPNLDLVHEALDAANLGARLTGRLLAFARRQPLTPQRVQIRDLMGPLTNLLRRTLGETVEVTSRLDAALWPVMSDPGQIENALLNLALNARDAMEGQGHLSFRIANFSHRPGRGSSIPGVPAGDFVRVDVTDTGCGMPPEIVDRIFDPFFTTKEQGSGTGLGLSMVYGFIRQSGGHIHVESAAGQGTAVTLLLPRCREMETDLKKSAKSKEEQPDRAGILLVEDNPAVRRAIRRMLERLGYRVGEAANGSAALEILTTASGDFALVLSDVVMPGSISGLELSGIVASRWPHLKCQLMSGYADIEEKSGGQQDLDLLHKPFRAEELQAVLDRLLATS